MRAAARQSVTYPEKPLSGELAIDWPAGTRFGVVISHDVDHLGLREHLVDGFLARYTLNVARQELGRRFRPLRALDAWAGIGLALLGHDRWDVVDELIEAETRAGLPATWFFPVRRGLGIAYSDEARNAAIRSVSEAGFEVGLHGQSPDDGPALSAEVRDLEAVLGDPVLGMRMHYLRLTSAALDGLEEVGVRYDTTVMNREDMRPETHPLDLPRLVRPGLLEIPLHVMDSTLFSITGLGMDARSAVTYFRTLMENAAARGRVIVVNLHPNNYSRQAPDTKEWFDALLAELGSRSDAFVTDFRGLLPRIVMP